MPVYDYRHENEKGPRCEDPFELTHAMSKTIESCPVCGFRVVKCVSSFSHRKNIFAPSNLKEKGFKRLRRRDKGVYEED